jgi:hypothetical protein
VDPRKQGHVEPDGGEKALLARFAKTAGAGEMLNIHDLKTTYEKAIG